MDNGIEIKTDGLANVIVRLNKIDPGLRKEIQRQMKQEANPIVTTARSLYPAASPLKNWGTWPRGSGPYTRSAATRGIKVVYKGSGKGNTIPLLTFTQTSAVGVIADMAGRANGTGKGSEGSRRGLTMIGALNRHTQRTASRFMYPAVEKNLPSVVAGLQRAVDDVLERFRREAYSIG